MSKNKDRNGAESRVLVNEIEEVEILDSIESSLTTVIDSKSVFKKIISISKNIHQNFDDFSVAVAATNNFVILTSIYLNRIIDLQHINNRRAIWYTIYKLNNIPIGGLYES
jgi:hypothetical protein